MLIKGRGFEVRGLRGLLPVYGSRFEVRGSRFEVRGSGFAVRGLRFGVCGSERLNKLNAGLIRGIGFEVRGSRFEVSARPGGEPMRAKKWSGAILFTIGTQRKKSRGRMWIFHREVLNFFNYQISFHTH